MIKERITDFFKKQSPARLISLGFALVIALGTILLKLPVSVRDGAQVSWGDALFTSTSAVCVTGLIAIDTADHFTVFGRAVVAFLIQVGGLGVTSVGVGVILAAGRRVGLKSRLLVREALNVEHSGGLVRLVRSLLLMTFCFETAGALLSFPAFFRDHDFWPAVGISLFHSVAAFNNSGFDILGGLTNLIPYQDSLLLNITTSLLIIFGGIGFLVIQDVLHTRNWKRLTLHSKVVISTSAVLLAAGTLLLKATEDITWLGAFFHSVSARTAGFSTYSLGSFTNAGLFVLIMLMFIGASPGSTGGGIKTTTFFAMAAATKAAATNQHCTAFYRKIPSDVIYKAYTIFFLSVGVVCAGTMGLCILEPEYSLLQLLFEATSAFGTVGLSTGITPDLSDASKMLLVLMMYTGRLGAMTVVSLWSFKRPTTAVYTEETINVG